MVGRRHPRPHKARNKTPILEPFRKLLWPFYRNRVGQIFAPACQDSRVRDGLALTYIARLFPYPEYREIVVELSGPVKVGSNIIVIGAAEMMVKWNGRRYRGPEVRPVGHALGQRLRKLNKLWCYRFSSSAPWVITNTVTEKTHQPSTTGTGADELLEDFGVIRCAYRGPYENTLILEGLHAVGTFGTCLATCTPSIIQPIVDALSELEAIDGYDPALPIEILVKTMYRPGLDGNRMTPGAMTPIPVKIVYNHDWVYDLREDRRWRDQTPPSLTIKASANTPIEVFDTVRPELDAITPRLEIGLDLRSSPEPDRRCCEDALRRCRSLATSTRPADAAAVEKLLSVVRGNASNVSLELFETANKGGAPHRHDLADDRKGYHRIRRIYLIEVLLGHLFDRDYPCDGPSLRRNLVDLIPKCNHPLTDERLKSHFVAQVAGKCKLSFPRLSRLDDGYTTKNYLAISSQRSRSAYKLNLRQLTLVFKLRS